jgi:preprotein translocase subunit SecY
MWLGEQIDKYGIGNGVSIILTAGILSRMPNAIGWVVENFDPRQTAEPGKIGIAGLAILVLSFVGITAGAVIMTVATRRIPIQQAKHTRGRKVYGGQKHYLPLRINHSGVMPIIFASSLMIFPSAIFGAWDNATANDSVVKGFTTFIARESQIGTFPYIVCEIAMIYFFAYFWTTVQMSPDDMAKQLKDHGSFIPGLRPGPRTAEYLQTVLGRITYVGAGFLAIIAVIPTLVTQAMGIPFQVSQFLGGTGLLIVVSVGLDLIQRLEANLVMRNYEGFSGQGGDARGSRMRSARG